MEVAQVLSCFHLWKLTEIGNVMRDYLNSYFSLTLNTVCTDSMEKKKRKRNDFFLIFFQRKALRNPKISDLHSWSRIVRF